MYTEKDFKTRWQKFHHPTMNVDGDVAFYYGVYKQIHDIAKESAKNMNDDILLQLAMFVEDAASVSFDSYYETRYRSVGEMVFYWCDKLGVDLKGTNQLYNTLTKAVADAPESSLKQWIKDCVLSGEIQRLKDVAMFYAIQDKTIGKLYPNLKYRKATFLELTGGDEKKAKDILESDLVFNWRDKDGETLLSRLAECFDIMKEGKEVAANLRTVQPLPLDSYLPLEMKDDGRTVTIMKKDNTTLDVIFPSRVTKKKIDEMCFVGQLVSYLGKTYVNGPVVWLEKNVFGSWDSDVFWSNIYEDEEESSRHKYFTTAYGNRYTHHQDLYGEFETDENGFYIDEPNIFDFFYWLTREKSNSER